MMNKKIASEFAIGIILILAIVIGGIFWMGNKKQTNKVDQVLPIQKTQKENSITDSVPAIMQDEKVTWYEKIKPVEIPELFKKNKNRDDISTKAWEVGSVKNSKEKVIFINTDDGSGNYNGYVFISTDEKLEKLRPCSQYSSYDFLVVNYDDQINDFIDKSVKSCPIVISSLAYPNSLTLANKAILKKELDIVNGDVIFDLENPFFYPEKFSDYKKVYSDNKYGNIFSNSKNGFLYLKTPIGTAKAYSLKIDFIDSIYSAPKVIWNDGTEAKDKFDFTHSRGLFMDVDDASEEVSINELVPAGKTNTGEIVYEYKDKNNNFLKKWYQENIDFLNEKNNSRYEKSVFNKNTTYDSFVNNHLVFFWKDPFGRLIRFINSNYVFIEDIGAGKPVIYLYPKKTENISVKVYPNGGITISDPVYNKGWKVIADPKSNIKNLTNGKTYPYLFWEGKLKDYQMPENGFVTPKENLENLLNDKLAKLGLIQKEINDFKEFWLPKMLAENKSYYFVTFVSLQEINKFAPLEINPKPDTIIRVLMDYKGLDQDKSYSELKIQTPERKGFVAVEWGGVLR